MSSFSCLYRTRLFVVHEGSRSVISRFTIRKLSHVVQTQRARGSPPLIRGMKVWCAFISYILSLCLHLFSSLVCGSGQLVEGVLLLVPNPTVSPQLHHCRGLWVKPANMVAFSLKETFFKRFFKFFSCFLFHNSWYPP